jgi:UDP-GlcNAc3NAcA epimerase
MVSAGKQKVKYILSTIHRQENTDDPKLLKDIFTTLSRLSSHVAKVILPLHPRTRKMVAQSGIEVKGIEIIDPIGYLEMLALLKHCEFVVTDSGGLQKEAYYLGKKCITLRPETEWTELVEYGYNYIPKNYLYDEVIMGIDQLKAAEITNFSIYGDGFASEKIIQVIEKA